MQRTIDSPAVEREPHAGRVDTLLLRILLHLHGARAKPPQRTRSGREGRDRRKIPLPLAILEKGVVVLTLNWTAPSASLIFRVICSAAGCGKMQVVRTPRRVDPRPAPQR